MSRRVFKAASLAAISLAALWLAIAPTPGLALQDGAQSKPADQKADQAAEQPKPETEYAEGGGDGWAKFRVARLKPFRMDKSGRWKSVPPMFEGAQVFQHALRQKDKSREIEFTVLEDGPIIMAASWTNDGPRAPEWYDTHTSRARMAANGWEPIGVAIRRSGARDDEYVLYRKLVRKGETYNLHTRRGGPPLLVIPAAAQRTAILAAKPINDGAELVSKSIRGARREVAEPTPPQVLLLDTYEIPTGGSAVNRGLVAREIIRQAVLLAGREELKLQTRDATLGEQFPNTAAQSNQLLGVVPYIGGDAMAQLMLFRGSTEKPEVLWYRVEACTKTGLLEELTTALERHSRGSLVEALRDSGFRGQAVASHESGPVGEDIERNLRNMTFPEQFRAVRSLHQLIRDEGASPQRLSALARAYANLGLLTEVHWNAAHAAYKARALLYAQRMLSQWPEKPLSYWTRGYVRTLVGRHAPAIADFEHAEKLNQDNADSIPAWARWAKAACDGESDLYSVGIAADGTEVARMLSLVQLEQFDEANVVLNAVGRVLEATPDCFRAVEVMGGVGSLGTRNSATRMGPNLVNHHLYQRLQRWSDLPDSIMELITVRDRSEQELEHEVRMELIDALHEAGSAKLDAGEPSFSAMASMLEELTFLHVRREVQLLAKIYGVPADELRKEREPLVRNPVYRWYLQLHADSPAEAREALKPLAEEIDRVNVSWRNMDLIDEVDLRGDHTLYDKLFVVTQQHRDRVMSDLWFARLRDTHNFTRHYLTEFARICPHAPAAVAATIRLGSEQIDKQRAEDLRQRYWDVPPILMSLARHHRDNKAWDEAETLLKRHIELAPDRDVYLELANIYLQQDDLVRWKATLDDFIATQPSPGLQHAQVRNLIARTLMERRRWQEALPYAEEAANSGAGWALSTAGNVHEALQHWEEAEDYYRYCSQRYVDAGADLYYFCRRTGQGDLESARAEAMKFAERAKEAADANHLWHLALLAVLEGEPEKALTHFEPAAKELLNPMVWLQTVLVAHEVKNHEVRDKYVDELIGRSAKYRENGESRPRLALEALGKLLKSKFAENGPITFTDDEIAAALEKADDDQQAQINYAIGRLLHLEGHAEQAAERYKNTMAYTRIAFFARTLAGYRLGQLGVPASSYRDLILGQDDKE